MKSAMDSHNAHDSRTTRDGLILVTWGYILDEEVSDIFALMCVAYSAGVVYGVVKYR